MRSKLLLVAVIGLAPLGVGAQDRGDASAQAGGNAFDAAVAVAAVLNLVEPQSSSIAGNGFATLFEKKTGKVYSLAMAGAAPKALKVAEMTEATLNAGMKAAVVPGNIGGLIAMLDRFGTKSLAEVLAPAIEYAEQGHPGAAMTLAIERRVPAATIKALEAMGHRVEVLADYTAGVGGMQGILVNQQTRTMTAGADPRRAGYAIGW